MAEKRYCPQCGIKSKTKNTEDSIVCVKCGYTHSTNSVASNLADKFTVKGDK